MGWDVQAAVLSDPPEPELGVQTLSRTPEDTER